MKRVLTYNAPWIALAAASVVLAWHPAAWLIRTWSDAAYDSAGAFYAIAIVALVGWSLTSGPATQRAHGVLPLLFFAAVLRLASQILAINLVGGAALAVDVYALALLFGVHARPRALSPFWLAILFLFTLPLEPVAQRLIGYPLQLASAELACTLLGALVEDVICDGTRLRVSGVDVLVDLPCSGAAGLLVMLAAAVALNAVRRPHFVTGTCAMLVMAVAALMSNGVRITALALGLIHDLPVMSAPWHDVIGLATLTLGLAPFVLFFRPRAQPISSPRWRPVPQWLRVWAGAFALPAAVLITLWPASPIDVSGPPIAPVMPRLIAGQMAQPQPLTPIEAHYFTAYGGAAAKASFGPLGLNLVSTRAPLRHLHSPETCLRGMGYTVVFQGTRYGRLPVSIYHATGPDGRQWHVAVTYVSDQGHQTSSIGEAIWLWLKNPNTTWTSLQRITPLSLSAAERAVLHDAAATALDLPLSPLSQETLS
jgi:exosortase/archaeosortase family protein